jgi:hypothetical protein
MLEEQLKRQQASSVGFKNKLFAKVQNISSLQVRKTATTLHSQESKNKLVKKSNT